MRKFIFLNVIIFPPIVFQFKDFRSFLVPLKKNVVFFALSIFSLTTQAQSVDPLTGRAIVNIPLGEISALDLGVSVNLNHHGDALKVSEGPGNAGMGWNVNMGGYIYREVRGLPDEYSVANDSRIGWLVNSTATAIQNFNPTANDDLSICTDEAADWTSINNLGYLKDPEPDIYHFSAPGISGKFIYDQNGTPKLIPYQDLQILPGFIIKTNTGITYTFGSTDIIARQAIQYKQNVPVDLLKSDYLYYQTPLNFISTWKLTTIQSGVTGAIVTYNYIPDELEAGSKFITRIAPNLAGQATTAVDTLYYLKDTYNTKSILSNINLKNYNINITWSNSLISSIRILETETSQVKEFDFIYKAIKGSGNLLLTKPFLLKVKQINSCVAFPDYQFYYTGVDTTDYSTMYPFGTVNIPWYTGWGQDVYGYYNGQDNNKNIPTVYYYQTETGARRLRVTPIPATTATQTLNGVSTSGSTMNVNSSTLGLGSLYLITYPTGGVTAINYEPNKYIDSSTGEELFGPGLRVTSIRTSGGEAAYGKGISLGNNWHTLLKSYQYLSTDGGPSSGKILYPPVFGFATGSNIYRSQSDLSPGSMVMYSRIKETISGQGYREYLYDVPNMYPEVSPIASSSKIARAVGATCAVGNLKNGVYTFPFAPSQDMDFKRGFLTKISEFSQAGVVTQEKSMTYILPQAVTTIKGLKFEAINDAQGNPTFHYSTYLIPISQSRILSQEVVKQVSELSSADQTTITSNYIYNSKNMVTQTTQTNSDNSIINQYIKYAQDYTITAPTVGDLQANAIYKLNSTSRYGEVIERYQMITPRAGTASAAGGQLTVFKDYGTYVWPYQVKHFPAGQSLTVSTASTGTTQGFVSDSDYILDATIDYKNGLPINNVGPSFMPTSVHYSTGTGIPLANFANCKEDHAVYEGFEFISTRGLVPTVTSPAPATPAGWTGKKSLTLTSSFALVTPATSLVTKGENSYRVSCWVYGTQTATITLQAKNGATVQSSQTMSYTTINQWTYLEAFIDMTAVSASFTFQVSTSATIQMDDFVAIPKSARLSFKTVLPFVGLTSETDDLGNSTVVNYDIMGRKVSTQDRKRNVVEMQEYGYQKQGAVKLQSSFTSSVGTNYKQGQAVTFTADPQLACFPQVTYEWTFYNYYGTESVATGQVVNKTFTSAGSYTVMLKVSNPNYPSSTMAWNICVFNQTINNTVSVGPTNAYHQCATPDDREKTFTASVTGLPDITKGWSVSYIWYVTDINGSWVRLLIPFDPNIVLMSGNVLKYNSPNYTYQVKCEVSAAQISGPQAAQCSLFTTESSASTIGVTFFPNNLCP